MSGPAGPGGNIDFKRFGLYGQNENGHTIHAINLQSSSSGQVRVVRGRIILMKTNSSLFMDFSWILFYKS